MESKRVVGVVLFEGFTMLDAYGPLQIFGSAAQRGLGYELVTLADRPGPVRPGIGPATVAEAELETPVDRLVVPGGWGTRTLVEDPAFVERIGRAVDAARSVVTVCSGAALVARSGRLDGRRATTNKLAWDWVILHGPQVRWERRARWTVDGRFATSSGVAAGIDLALALVSEDHGPEMARDVASRIEHVWDEDPANDPFA